MQEGKPESVESRVSIFLKTFGFALGGIAVLLAVYAAMTHRPGICVVVDEPDSLQTVVYMDQSATGLARDAAADGVPIGRENYELYKQLSRLGLPEPAKADVVDRIKAHCSAA